jgi:hypothetical protein
MKRKLHILIPLALMSFSANGWTAMADDGEATIRLMEASEAEDTSEVTRVISLPAHLLDAENQVKAVERAQKGHDTANENVSKDLPDNASDQAREARENANEMSEQAKENRENRGRSEDRPDPPNRPENPGRPE